MLSKFCVLTVFIVTIHLMKNLTSLPLSNFVTLSPHTLPMKHHEIKDFCFYRPAQVESRSLYRLSLPQSGRDERCDRVQHLIPSQRGEGGRQDEERRDGRRQKKRANQRSLPFFIYSASTPYLLLRNTRTPNISTKEIGSAIKIFFTNPAMT